MVRITVFQLDWASVYHYLFIFAVIPDLLNLALQKIMSDVKILENTLGIIQELYVFIEASNKTAFHVSSND